MTNDACVITSKNSGKKVYITMPPNKMFSLNVSDMKNFALATSAKDDSKLLHLRYNHLNINDLILLGDKGMVFGLPKISSLDLCEG